MKKRQVPTKWDRIRRRLATIQSWAMLDYTEKEIAAKLDVSVATFRRYKTEHPELAAALEKGAEDANAEVEHSLFEKSTGFTKEVKKMMKVKRIEYEDGKKLAEYEEFIPVIEEQYFPPDQSAQQYWLNNRKPDKWKSKQEVGLANANGEALNINFTGELKEWSQ